MKFRRRAKLFPGVYLNFSKTGISTTIGIPGANINIGKKGVYLNAGIPGTGLYDRQKIGGGSNDSRPQPHLVPSDSPFDKIEHQSGSIQSQKAEETTTQGLANLKSTLLDCYEERESLKKEIIKAQSDYVRAKTLSVISIIFLVGFFVKWFRVNKSEKADALAEVNRQLNDCFVKITLDVDTQFASSYKSLFEAYKLLASSRHRLTKCVSA